MKEKSKSIRFGFLPAVAFVIGLSSSVNGYSQSLFPVLFEAVHHAVLSSERAGVLTTMNYNVGDSVKKGAVVAKMDIGELVLMKKRSSFEFSFFSSKLEDLKKLSSRGLGTNEDITKTKMEKDLAYTDMEILKRQISKSDIRAPFNCVVIKRLAEAHEWVTEGKPVVEVVSPNTIRAVSNISSALAVNLKEGDVHEFTVHDLNTVVKGTLDAIVPQVDELSNTVQVIWKVDKKYEKLLPGMKGEVRID